MQQVDARQLGTNVPAVVIGWEKEGRAKVEILSDAEGHKIGTNLTVGVRPDPRGRAPHDFALLNKQGLRVGGIVLLRRLKIEDGEASARAVETLVMRESDGAPFVIQNVAACILPPPPGTAMVNEAMVALIGEAVAGRSLSESLTKIVNGLDQPGIFGFPGLIYTGRLKGGEAVEVIIGGDAPIARSDLVSRFLRECPKDVIKESRTSGTSREPWRLIPFFRCPIDPDRSSKLSAQSVNHSYGDDTKPQWTTGHVVLRAISDRWHLSDASPADEPTKAVPIIDAV